MINSRSPGPRPALGRIIDIEERPAADAALAPLRVTFEPGHARSAAAAKLLASPSLTWTRRIDESTQRAIELAARQVMEAADHAG